MDRKEIEWQKTRRRRVEREWAVSQVSIRRWVWRSSESSSTRFITCFIRLPSFSLSLSLFSSPANVVHVSTSSVPTLCVSYIYTGFPCPPPDQGIMSRRGERICLRVLDERRKWKETSERGTGLGIWKFQRRVREIDAILFILIMISFSSWLAWKSGWGREKRVSQKSNFEREQFCGSSVPVHYVVMG